MNLLESKNQHYSLFYLKQGILLFWCIWFTLAFLTNLTDFLITTHVIEPFPFRSGNYIQLEKVISIYNLPQQFLNLLFILNIIIQGLSAILFLSAAICFWSNKYTWQSINIAFSISMFLWAAFLVLEEVFIAYSFEAVHIKLFMFEMLSLLTLHLLPPPSSRRAEFIESRFQQF